MPAGVRWTTSTPCCRPRPGEAPEGAAGWVLWLEDPARGGWTAAEAAALAVAARVFAGRAGGAPRWAGRLDGAARQQALEAAADVARRLAHDFGNVLTAV